MLNAAPRPRQQLEVADQMTDQESKSSRPVIAIRIFVPTDEDRILGVVIWDSPHAGARRRARRGVMLERRLG
jgi:hypothetical protein